MSAHNEHGHGGSYELSDAHVPSIIKYGVAMFVIIAITMAMMWALHLGFAMVPMELEKKPTDWQMNQKAIGQDEPSRSMPMLQVDQPRDLKSFRAREDSILHTYGKEPMSGAVRIPVERAIEVLSERGLAATAGAPKPAAARPVPAAKGAAQ